MTLVADEMSISIAHPLLILLFLPRIASPLRLHLYIFFIHHLVLLVDDLARIVHVVLVHTLLH